MNILRLILVVFLLGLLAFSYFSGEKASWFVLFFGWLSFLSELIRTIINEHDTNM